MYGLKIRLEAPYFASFRRPTSTSTLLTFSLPPFTTIRGLISNAMGLPRDDLMLQETQIKIGIKPIIHAKANRETAKILKFKGGEHLVRRFSSSPMHREFLVEASYYIYLVGKSDNIKEIEDALKNPHRFLYLGSSDDFVDVHVEKSLEVEEAETEYIDSAIEGIFEGCTIEKIPYNFHKTGRKYSVEYKTMSVPKKFPYMLKEPIKLYVFGEEKISCI